MGSRNACSLKQLHTGHEKCKHSALKISSSPDKSSQIIGWRRCRYRSGCRPKSAVPAGTWEHATDVAAASTICRSHVATPGTYRCLDKCYTKPASNRQCQPLFDSFHHRKTRSISGVAFRDVKRSRRHQYLNQSHREGFA